VSGRESAFSGRREAENAVFSEVSRLPERESERAIAAELEDN
jgi:hypothetical protein